MIPSRDRGALWYGAPSFLLNILEGFIMNILSDITKYKESNFDKLIVTIKLIKSIPTNVPVFFECKCLSTFIVTNVLVIPEYFSNEYFCCILLAADDPDLCRNSSLTKTKNENIVININSILSWEPLGDKSFLNFGKGFITQRYLNMVTSSS